MESVHTDFNDADAYFSHQGYDEWADLSAIIADLRLHTQASQQAGKEGAVILDPKATNAALTRAAFAEGWSKILMPSDLRMFGFDADAGKGTVLAEWQFSNYPYLWNNLIRSEALHRGGQPQPPMDKVEALVIVTRAFALPSSNGVLYYEQARAQITTMIPYGMFTIPVRLVGLTIPLGCTEVDATWTTYPGRTSRTITAEQSVTHQVRWGNAGQYGVAQARLQ